MSYLSPILYLHRIVRLIILNLNESWSLCTSETHRVDRKGYTDMSICTYNRDIVTVTKQSSSEQSFPCIPTHKDCDEESRRLQPSLSIGFRIGELSRRKTNAAVTTV